MGILCRGCISVSISWDAEQRIYEFVLNSKRAHKIAVKFPFAPAELECSEKISILDSDLGSNYICLDLPAGKDIFIKLSRITQRRPSTLPSSR